MSVERPAHEGIKGSLKKWPALWWLLRQRFTKFGAVGFSGTLVNMAMLYVGQEFLFRSIPEPAVRFNVSLGTAIFVSTLHNFIWNRSWTWKDRKHHKPVALQFVQYCTACWVAITMQMVLTNIFRHYMHYLIANALAIAITAVINYLINHAWTFRKTKQTASR